MAAPGFTLALLASALAIPASAEIIFVRPIEYTGTVEYCSHYWTETGSDPSGCVPMMPTGPLSFADEHGHTFTFYGGATDGPGTATASAAAGGNVEPHDAIRTSEPFIVDAISTQSLIVLGGSGVVDSSHWFFWYADCQLSSILAACTAGGQNLPDHYALNEPVYYSLRVTAGVHPNVYQSYGWTFAGVTQPVPGGMPANSKLIYFASTPEPSTFGLLAAGGLMLACRRYRGIN